MTAARMPTGVDAASFRRAVGQFASGVTVVTTRNAAGHPLGMTVSAFCSVSLQPPLVLVCIDHRADTNAGMRARGLFGVSVLRVDQEEISRRFASRGRRKFHGLALAEGAHGMPLVPGALAQLECRVRSFHEEGDHTVWVGEVISLAASPGLPLVHHAGAYRRLEPRDAG